MKKKFSPALIVLCVLLTIWSIPAAIGQDRGERILMVNGAGMASDQVEKWAKQFMEKTPEVFIMVIVSNAQRGFQSLLDDTADIAMMSRDIMPNEREEAAEKGLQIAESAVGLAAVSVITHPRNPLNELTLDQLKKLYSGEYDNWKSVGGPDEPVKCLSRRVPESGGALFFQERVLGGKPFGAKTVFVDRWYSIIKICAEGKYLPIGIIPHTRDTNGVKVLRIKRDVESPAVAPSEENIRNQVYPIVLSYSFVWNARSEDPAVKSFVDFCKGQGRTE
jgi:phosphate transport system substrate-binding protein